MQVPLLTSGLRRVGSSHITYAEFSGGVGASHIAHARVTWCGHVKFLIMKMLETIFGSRADPRRHLYRQTV